MITPVTTTFTGWIGSTFDTTITVYPSVDSQYTWVGLWQLGTNYSANQVVIGPDTQAYDSLKANISVNPVGDGTGTWSTPLTPMNLNGWTGTFTIAPIGTNPDELVDPPLFATPVQIQGLSGLINIRVSPIQSATPIQWPYATPLSLVMEPGDYHHWLAMSYGADTYYFLNGTFTWNSP